MLLGQNPGFERETGSVRSKCHEILILAHHASAAIHFLPDNVAEDATLFVQEILLGAFEFLGHVDGKNRQRDQLGVRMLQRRPGSLAMILEDQNVLKPAVLLQVENAVAEGPQNIFDAFRWQGREVGIVVWSLDDYLVRANAV